MEPNNETNERKNMKRFSTGHYAGKHLRITNIVASSNCLLRWAYE